jgi:GMP synthase (glutamine-hydrolysing)
MRALCLLVADGEIADGRRRVAETAGATFAESYANILRDIANAVVDIFTPADENATPPRDLGAYDGIAVTGSSLNIHKRERASLRQIEFVREVFARGIPMFGSCWGLQLAAVAAGGDVAPNRAGREIGFARHITLTEAGRSHALHAGRPLSFDAPAIHADEVTRLPENAVVTAANAMSSIQAAEIRFGKSVFWGVQYHPEFSLHDVAAMLRRNRDSLLSGRFFSEQKDLDRYAADIDLLQCDRARRDLAWRLGLNTEITDDRKRIREIINWISQQVIPNISARG